VNVDHEFRQLSRGDEPAEEVVELADEVGAELAVIGIRRRSAVGKLLFGSTAQRILMDTHCPSSEPVGHGERRADKFDDLDPARPTGARGTENPTRIGPS
jgi:hypothetical protein